MVGDTSVLVYTGTIELPDSIKFDQRADMLAFDDDTDIYAVMITSDRDTEFMQKLRQFHTLSPRTRVILEVNTTNTEEIIQLVNQGLINCMFTPASSHTVPELITQLSREYFEEIHQNAAIMHHNSLDGLIEMTVNLSLIDEIHDFSNQYVSIVNGLLSLIRLNARIYFESESPPELENVMNYLLDMEVFANQYDQSVLVIYINLLRAYFSLAAEKIAESVSHYRAAVRAFYWISTEALPETMIETANTYPIYEDKWFYIQSGEETFEIDEQMMKKVRSAIDDLLAVKMSDVINISRNLVKHLGTAYQPLQMLIVVRESLPVYTRDIRKSGQAAELLTGFVSALSNFLQEVVEGEGDIDTISHDQGIILMHTAGRQKYILMSKSDDAHIRIGLRQFAERANDIMEAIPTNTYIDEEKEIEVNELADEIFVLHPEDLEDS